MGKLYIILIFGIIFLSGCGKAPSTDRDDNAVSSEQLENKKEIYWQRTEDLGLAEKSVIRLESKRNGSNLTLVIDGYPVSLKDEKEISNENYNFTKIIKNDFDKDGIMEVILLFFGGAGGTYQNFQMIKYDNQKWDIVHMDLAGLGDTPFVNVEALKNRSVKIYVRATGYKNTVKIPRIKYMAEKGKTTIVGVGYSFFELQKDSIVVAYRLYLNNLGDSFGDVRQKIQFDASGKKLIFGETGYMPIEEANKRSYEVY